MDAKLLRRNFLIGGGSSMLVAATGVRPVAAKPVENKTVTPEEQANVRLLKAFLGSWAKPNMDVTKFLKIFARGPLVATARIDTVNIPRKPVQTLEVAGVAIIKDHKIQEYCDYIIS